MLRNYLVSAWRSILKHRYFNLIHIGGLAIGLTAAILVIHYARIEYSLDNFHADGDRIYRVASARLRDGVEATRFATTFAGAGPAIAADYPEVEHYTRLFYRSRGGIVSRVGSPVRFRETGMYNVDSGFFNVFSFPILAGSADELNAPQTAFIEEAAAVRYFGDTDPIGQRITFGTAEGVEEYEIRGVVRCPENSSITFNFLLSYHGLGHFFGTEHYTNWNWLDFHTFLKLRPGTDAKQLENRLPALLKKYRGDRAVNSKLLLQPLPDIYLQSKTEFETGKTGDESLVRILMVLGFVLLAIVGFNFINLSTSISLTRAREVGIRKTLGSDRRQLVLQFLTETGLTHLAAALITTLLLWMLLPYFNLITGRHLLFSGFFRQDLWQYLLVFFVGGTLLLGTWPALQLSAFRPAEVMKGSSNPQGTLLRKGFVAFQAFVSFSLVAVILIILDQVRFIQTQDLGLRVDHTLVMPTPAVVNSHDSYHSSIDAFRAALMSNADITEVTAAADCPGKEVGWLSGARRLGAPLNEGSSMYRADIDDTFVPMMELTVLAGQPFSKTSPRSHVLINETAMRQFAFDTPEAAIGQRVHCGYDTVAITGVLKDYHQVSPREAVSPMIYHNRLETPSWFMVRFADEADPAAVVRHAQATFAKHFPADFFDYFFLDEFYDRQYELERRLALIMLVFCALAVIVSALGLLGLTWFTVSRRKKELAIRKVVGSSDAQLYRHAAGGIFLTTLAGCALGVPSTAWLMTQWLNTFALHTAVKPWVFGVALLTALLVALVTVSGYTLKVIRTNPVVHLRRD